MRISRRGFLKLAALSSGSIIAAYIFVRHFSPFHAMYRRLIASELYDAPAVPLDYRALANLLAVTRLLTHPFIENDHYEDFLKWRSENIRGYKYVYEKISLILENKSMELFSCSFLDCDAADQLAILGRIRPRNRLDKVNKAVFSKDDLLFERFFIFDVLSLYARTDAWIELGYESWPGKPRGLNRYMRAPAGRE